MKCLLILPLDHRHHEFIHVPHKINGVYKNMVGVVIDGIEVLFHFDEIVIIDIKHIVTNIKHQGWLSDQDRNLLNYYYKKHEAF